MSDTLRFDDGAVQFRQRIVVSLLSHRPLFLQNIRSDDLEAPGLQRHEASFLRLIDKLTNGSRIEINNTGTQLRFKPGVLLGGDVEHDCPIADKTSDDEDAESSVRSIGWFLEGILPLAPFGKEPLSITLTGITDGDSHRDPSADYFRSVLPYLTQHFGIGIDEDEMSPSLRILRRGGPPQGGGQVHLYCPIVKELKSIDLTDMGKFKRVRGTAISCKVVTTSLTARVAHSAKGLLHRLLPDVWIHTDVHTIKKNQCGPNPSLSLILSGLSTTGVVMTAEACRLKEELPEDLGKRGAAMLLEEIRRGGCIDTSCQSWVLLWMCLTPEDASRIRLGTLSQYTIESLRLFKKALDVEFKVKADHSSKTVLMSCLGTGYRNMAKAST